MGRAVALEGTAGEVLAVHAPPRPPTAARAAARYLADPRAVALRAPLAGTTALVLLGPEPVTELERTIARRVGPLLALALGHVAPAAARPPRPPPGGVPRGRPAMGRADGPPGRIGRGRQRARRERRCGHASVGWPGRATCSSAATPTASSCGWWRPRRRTIPLALRLAERVATVAGRLVAVSQPFAAPEARAVAEADARATLDAASALPPPSGRPERLVVRADRQAAYRLLSNLHNLPDGYTQAQRLLAPAARGSRQRAAGDGWPRCGPSWSSQGSRPPRRAWASTATR